MLSEIFLPYLEFQIKALKFLKAAPYDFNKVTNEVTIAESKFARKFRLIVQILEWVYFFAMCRVVYRLKENKCHGQMMEGVMIAICTLNLLLFSCNWNPNVKTAALMNALVKFDATYGMYRN